MSNKIENKIMRLDVIGTLRALPVGDTVIFRVAGDGAEVALETLRVAKSKYHLPVTIKKLNNGTHASVTKIATAS